MKIKIYLNDWFYNSGIVGFIKILKHSNNQFEIRKNNYIEIDTEDLRNFHKYYFQYFFDKYNVAESVKNRTEKQFEYLENSIEITLENDEEKQRKDKIKTNKKYIKETIKRQLDKIKKIDEQTYEKIKEQYNKIDKETTKQGIIEIKEKILENISKEKINKKVTLNFFRTELGNEYFGQASFFQKSIAPKDFEEQQEIMYKDYISDIVEEGYIQDIIDGKYEINEVEEYIKNINKKNIKSDIQKIYASLQKNYISKNKTLEEIKTYLKEKERKQCSLCGNEALITEDYSEKHFVPLAISNKSENFFWNGNIKMPICDICRLILFCTPAGMTKISKVIKNVENKTYGYKEKDILSFVNLDTNVDKLYKTNMNLGNKSKYENRDGNPYTELILDIIEQDKKISEWQLQNIFVVEFEAEYGAYSRIEYFNIKRYVAKFLSEYSENTLSKIKDYRYRLQIVDYILKNKDIKYIINDRLRDEMKKDEKKEPRYVYNSFLATRVRMILNLLKKEDIKVEEIKKNDAKLKVLYNLGVQMHEDLKRTGEENKIDGYTYRMLNSIKAGNKKQFMDIVIRIHMSMGKDISPIFIETMQSEGLDFESIAHSFLSGLISNRYKKNSEEEHQNKISNQL